MRFLVVDATGVGAALCSFLASALPGRVLPLVFNTRTKSDLCWSFLGLCDSARFQDHAPLYAGVDNVSLPPTEGTNCDPIVTSLAAAQVEFWRQVKFCEFEILPGPNKTVRWGVPDGTRDPASGDLVHDDLLISAAMLSLLDEQDWSISAPTLIIQASDPLEDIDATGF